jgi:hypothetical protein
MSRLYFDLQYLPERCFSLSAHRDRMKEVDVESLTLHRAQPVRDVPYIYCKAVQEVGERGECGRSCPLYAPRNGKSGACRHLGRLYEPTDETLVLTL